MNERIIMTDKKPEANSHLMPQIRRKTESSQSMDSPVDRILFLQKTIGNQAVARLIKSGALQAKLKIGQPGDIYEQEADRMAEQVMRMPDISEAKDTRIQRKCPKCLKGLTRMLGQDKKEDKLQAKETPGQVPEVTPQIEANINALKGGGQPLPESTRAFFEPRFGQDFSQVRVHTNAKAAEAARVVAAQAYTMGNNITFAEGQYTPNHTAGRHLLAHELTHVVQQRAGGKTFQRRAANCPAAPPLPPTITTMADFIALVQRVEASTPTGSDPIATARLISRTKYEGRAWDWLLPSTKGTPGVGAGGTVTADDVASLCFKLFVSVPGGGMEDPMHVIAAIVADAETLPAGTGATGLSRFVDKLPASVSQRSASTWVGDVGKAAAEWMTVHPLPKGGNTKADYMLEDAPPHDLMADVDGVAMTSKSTASGFAFDKTKPLSDNLQRFFVPAKHTGRERRFHVFCSAEGFALEADGFTLTAGAKATIGQRVKDFAEWFEKNDPDILKWVTLTGGSWPMSKAWVDRAGDWQWFADEFIKFVQKNLTAEGP